MPVIRILPDPPSTTDPINFASKADAHVLALQDFTTDVNNFAAELEAADVIAPSLDTIAATATTTQLWNYSKIQNWTGTPTITDLPDAPQSGARRVVYPTAGTVLTNNANISVQGNSNYTVAAGDECTITAITTSTFYISIIKKDGSPIVSGTQAGFIGDYGGASAPSGWLACPLVATNISRTTYAALFAAIGTNWGAGDGSTTFGIPFFPADYVGVQANGNVGTQTTGDVKSHSHLYNNFLNSSSLYRNTGGSDSITNIPSQTDLTGGSANLAAGVRVLKCVKI